MLRLFRKLFRSEERASAALKRKSIEIRRAMRRFRKARFSVDYKAMQEAMHEHDRLANEWIAMANEYAKKFL